jgi:serine/threonine-protein kinase
LSVSPEFAPTIQKPPNYDDADHTPTQLKETGNQKQFSNPTSEAGRFIAGTVLANRYRIIGLLGKGGMGEVFKAEDIKLNQTVALKFLPDKLEKDKAALERFHAEVRNARQVSHVNVCRVFDISEIDGRHFLSMEFIDGDDLSSLLRRIGRLPSDKAIEIARQLCFGLAAIHEAGILHRDLKPANVIIDSRGKARITDFGIAGIEEELTGGEIRVGTPAYMSPEQITGKEVTPKSDIYSLGLLLYEIFTGKQTFQADSIDDLLRKQQTNAPTNPSEVLKDIDPIVEKTILQCLEKNPADRPKNSLQVAMMLPGGSPLEAAILAGETPSPEMVAAAPKKGALKPIVAVALLAAVFVSIGLEMLHSKRRDLHRMVPLEKSSEILGERSREMAEKFGYPSFDSQYRFTEDRDYLKHIEENDKTPTRWQKLATGQPAVMQFWYRLSPQPLIPVGGGTVGFNDPPNDISGMAQMRLDTKGRLIFFDGVPPRVDEAGGATKDFDWESVFKEAGFNLADFENAESQWTPRREFDERRAWTGKYPEQPDIAIRVEAAAYRGKIVRFEIVEPWSKPAGQAANQGGSNLANYIFIAIFFGILIGSAWLAVKNVRGGRSDLQGAFRLTLFFFALQMIRWAFETHHVASAEGEVGLLITGGLQTALSFSCFVGLMYLAFEPYLRKHAPERVISWNRLLAGDWRDPLVGRDVLIGLAATAILIELAFLNSFVPRWLGNPPSVPLSDGLSLLGIRGFPALFLNQVSMALVYAFIVSFLVLFFNLLLRRKWLGNAAVWLIITVPFLLSSIAAGQQLHWLVFGLMFSTWVVFLTARFGVLAMVSGHFYLSRYAYPITSELSAWYAGDYVLFVVVLAALAIYGFYTSLAGQKIFEGKILRDIES